MKNDGSSVKQMQDILDDGRFFSKVSAEATAALYESIKIKNKKVKKSYLKKHLTFDFQAVNIEAIKKRGNLKVYDSLPKGIRVVAR